MAAAAAAHHRNSKAASSSSSSRDGAKPLSSATAASSSKSSSSAAPPPPMWAPPSKSSSEADAARALYSQRSKDIAAAQADIPVTERGVPKGMLFEATAARRATRTKEMVAADSAKLDALIATKASSADKAYEDVVTCERPGCRRDPFNNGERTSEEGTGMFCCRTCEKGLLNKKGNLRHGPVCNTQWNNSNRCASEWEYEQAQGWHD
jgi:hypothetical protein